MHKHILIGLIVGIIFIGGCIQQEDSRNPTSVIKVKLLDAFSEQIIPNTDVRIWSDNGIRCITAPCPTEGKEWTGKSDNSGIILIPSEVINVATTITAVGYKSGKDLNGDSEKIDNNNWIIELDPDSKIDNFERQLKLIDLQTQKPLSNIALWVIRNPDCQPPQCSDYCFEGITNNMGNVYYPISSSAGNKCFDRSIFAKTNVYTDLKDYKDYWIFIDNYKVVKFPTGWVNYKVALEKE